ncbi:MAG: NAD(P)/FAD-dependent oxidoreductase [Armatimonadota bacterium]
MAKTRVVVIGAGPAGIMSAGQAALCGAKVFLLEKGPIAARKLRITGKGRCNITNTAELEKFIDAFEPNGRFLYGCLNRFSNNNLIAFINQLGVNTKVERGGRVFPESDSASEVAEAIIKWALECGVSLKLNKRVKAIVCEENKVIAVDTYSGRINCDAAVVATGGASYPKTGSDGDGYDIAAKLGHTITPIKPALSALITKESWVSILEGISLKNVIANLLIDDNKKPHASEFGEMLFTNDGISGPIILTLSRKAGRLIEKHNVYISIDLKPALTEEQLHQRLISDFKQNIFFKNYIPSLLPKRFSSILPCLTNIEESRRINSITAEERKNIVSVLKGLKLQIKSLDPLENAIVTSGGVNISEIDPKTMESKIINGLFFAGEVIDIDAETGGYNLQAAFSTGYIAGISAANLKK